ncbi:MAG: FHA domain-containing protein, partial [Pseudomonadota bacterium]
CVKIAGQDLFLGRSDLADVCIVDPSLLTSRRHAAIIWTGTGFRCDILGRNGLLIDGTFWKGGTATSLGAASELMFGDGIALEVLILAPTPAASDPDEAVAIARDWTVNGRPKEAPALPDWPVPKPPPADWLHPWPDAPLPTTTEPTGVWETEFPSDDRWPKPHTAVETSDDEPSDLAPKL